MIIKRLTNKQSGFTLMEVLIAMALGLTIMSGVVSILVLSKNNFVNELELATLQENARFSMQYLSNEIRMAGYSGCHRQSLNSTNIINTSPGSWYLNGIGVEGFERLKSEAGRGALPVEFRSQVNLYSDVLVLRRGEQSGLLLTESYSPASAILPLNKAHDFQKGTVMMIAAADCQQLGFFQISNPDNQARSATVMSHEISGSISPGNCSRNLSAGSYCSSDLPVGGVYGTGSSVMRLKSEAFYIGNSRSNGVPTLFRETLLVAQQRVRTTAQELVQGVENMHLLYGLDTNGNDGTVDTYVSAAANTMDWSTVVSVRVSLRLRSTLPIYNTNQPYEKFMGIDGTEGSDRYLRQVVTTTVHLRNR